MGKKKKKVGKVAVTCLRPQEEDTSSLLRHAEGGWDQKDQYQNFGEFGGQSETRRANRQGDLTRRAYARDRRLRDLALSKLETT